MYGKVFESIYDGTLAGHWQAIVTMQQLIVLADEDGVVDMTPEAISRRTTIPLKIIAAGLEHLQKPDPYSRTPGEDGRRIVLLDDHRPWGWKLVNYGKYRGLRNMEQKREADRQRLAEKRKKNKDVATASPGVANVAHADAYVEANAEAEKSTTTAPDASRRAPKVNGHRVSFDFEKGAFQGITEEDELRWQEAYPAVPIPPAISQAAAWLKANPANRKRNYERFLVNWFSRSQDRAGRVR